MWEGINSTTFHYNILELNAEGHHRFINASVVTALKKVKTLKFNDQDIACTNFECIINITTANNKITRLIISPYLETSLKVLEINADSDGRPIYTEIYQLDFALESSTVKILYAYIVKELSHSKRLKVMVFMVFG